MTERFSIVIPVYKSSKTLFRIADKLEKVFSTLPYDYEIILVNDSPFYEATNEALRELVSENKKVVGIKLTKNFGQQPATLCGLNYAKGDYIITMDDDLQHNPDDISKLIALKAHDVVIAKFPKKQHSLFKNLGSKIKGYFDHVILGKPKHIKLSSYRLMSKATAEKILSIKTPYPFIPALLFSVTNDIVNVEIDHHTRDEGRSNYTFFKMLKLFSNLIINNSSLLLRFIGYLGFSSALVSVVIAVVVVVKKMTQEYILQGWTSLILSVLFFGGLTLFALGVIGEYLIRIVGTAESRPVYFVREISRSEE
ncbi:glycosyltransferase family 2 protein [Winogradskyella sp.]|uniref:glycosyltransferase family 2 protein n=1 Tax=Winogradskyella sp. TaxID=1883156 RepID=UPI00261A9B06|nr:glycosyltransferase family 2 protein [Winogradskyella sp.]